MSEKILDSFGQEVEVGDYLTFATKTKYLGSLGIGRVTKIGAKGHISMVAISTSGRTFEDYYRQEEERYQRLIRDYPTGDWSRVNPANGLTYKITLHSASTCFKVAPTAVPLDIAGQLIQACNG